MERPSRASSRLTLREENLEAQLQDALQARRAVQWVPYICRRISAHLSSDESGSFVQTAG